MNTRPLRSEVEARIRTAKADFTKASADLIAGKPNAAEHGRLALQRLNRERATLALLDEQLPTMEA